MKNLLNTYPNFQRKIGSKRNSVLFAGNAESYLSIKSVPKKEFKKFMDKQFKLLVFYRQRIGLQKVMPKLATSQEFDQCTVPFTSE